MADQVVASSINVSLHTSWLPQELFYSVARNFLKDIPRSRACVFDQFCTQRIVTARPLQHAWRLQQISQFGSSRALCCRMASDDGPLMPCRHFTQFKRGRHPCTRNTTALRSECRESLMLLHQELDDSILTHHQWLLLRRRRARFGGCAVTYDCGCCADQLDHGTRRYATWHVHMSWYLGTGRELLNLLIIMIYNLYNTVITKRYKCTERKHNNVHFSNKPVQLESTS